MPDFDQVMEVVQIHDAERSTRRGWAPPRPTPWNQRDPQRWRGVLEAMAGATTIKQVAAACGISATRAAEIVPRLMRALVDGGFLMAGGPRQRVLGDECARRLGYVDSRYRPRRP